MNDFSLTRLEDRFALRDRPYSRHRPGLYPSEASVEYIQDGLKIVDGKCMRAAWYRSMKIPKTDPAGPKLNHTADLGKWDEIGLIERWKELGLWVDNNVKFYRADLAMSGELDAILKSPDGSIIGYEIKSIYGRFADDTVFGKSYVRQPSIPGRPKEDQLLQALVYEWEYKDELDQYRMFYLERGDGRRVEFEVGSDTDKDDRCWYRQVEGDYWEYFEPGIVYLPFTIHDIHARYKQLVQYLRGKTLPPCDFEEVYSADKIEQLWSLGKIGKTKYQKWQKKPDKEYIGDWQCSYCAYKSQCKQDRINSRLEKKE